jgi:hypothetical protein
MAMQTSQIDFNFTDVHDSRAGLVVHDSQSFNQYEFAPWPDEADPNRPTPSHLYKYRPLNDDTSRDRLRSILVGSRLYFPSRLDFNDPFDCLFPSFFNVNRRDLTLFIKQRLKGMGLRGGDAKAAAKRINSTPTT